MQKFILLFIIPLTILTCSPKQVLEEVNMTEQMDVDGTRVKEDFKEAIMEFSELVPEDSLYIPDWLNEF